MKTKNIISTFINSFRLDKRFWQVLLLDFIFIILFLSLIPLYTFTLRLNLDVMKPLDSSAMRIKQMIDGNYEPNPILTQDLKLASTALRLFFLKMSIISLLFLTALLTIIGYFKTKEWSKILKEKFNKHIIIKLASLVLVWNLIWILLFLLIVFGLKFDLNTIKTIAIVEFFLYIYFSMIIMPIFFRNKKIMKSIKETFVIGTLKFYAILPGIIAIWLLLSLLLGLLIVLTKELFYIILIPFALLFLTWMKFYINAVVDKIYI